jgi:YYY domain-containing protein
VSLAAAAAWWAACAGLLAAGAPVAAALFGRRGVGLGLPVALVAVTLAAYWVGQASFGPAATAAAVLAPVGLGLAGRRMAGPRVDRRALAEALVVFTVAYAGYVGIRAVGPDVVPGGEHFLDYSLLKALGRAAALPPEDPWFAGETVRYYYGGHLTVAVLARLTGTPARVAYHLGVAGTLATLATAAYALAGAVAADRGVAARPAALAGAFFVGVAGHLLTPLELLAGALPDRAGAALADALSGGLDGWAVGAVRDGTAALSDTTTVFVVPGAATVFPLLEGLNGYLHAHVLATPSLALAAALGYAYYRTDADETGRRRLLLFVAIPACGGVAAVTSTWAAATVVGVAWLALATAPAGPLSVVSGRLAAVARGDGVGRRELARAGGAVALSAAVAGVAALAAAPFLFGPAAPRPVAPFGPEGRTPLAALLVVHGAFLAAFVPYLAGRTPRRWVGAAAAVGVGLVVVRPDLAALAVVGPVGIAAWALLRRDAEVGFETVLVLAGAGLVVLVEFVYVLTDGHGNRFNTVYKVSMHVRVLWGVAAGVVLAALVERVRSWPAVRARLASAGLAAVVLAAGAYGAVYVPGNVADAADPDLDALDAVERRHPAEVRAIRWLDRREGTPTLLSAPGVPQKRWNASPAASLTGIPTVAGWRHEAQYRSPAAYRTRVDHADAMYAAAPRRQVALLRRYDVQYVYVGPAERERYDDPGSIARLRGVTVAFSNPTVTVYRVDRDRLAVPARGVYPDTSPRIRGRKGPVATR